MKFFFVIVGCFLFCFFSVAQTAVKTKHALIFAIGDYPTANGWPKISSVTDVGYIKDALKNQQFLDKNIAIVTDSNATIAGIKTAFIELINKVKAGDIVVIHFSCHGEQVKADNNNKIDGLDECVVTYNAISPYQSKDFDKDQSEYLRGHVLGTYLTQLRSKAGRNGDVIVFMDFCHSGNSARGLAKVRGGQPPLVPKGYDIDRSHKVSDSSLLFRESNSYQTDESSLASLEVVSATRPEELDYETTNENGLGVGSLSYAISKAFENLEPGSTYRSFFAKVQSIMNVKVPEQHPLLEGNGIDRLMFGGQFVYQKPYFEIASINRYEIILKSGLLAGLDSGTKVAVYPSGTVDPSRLNPINTGTVVKAGNFFSIVNLDSALKIRQSAAGWVFVKEKTYKIAPINIKIISKITRSADPVIFSAADVTNIQNNLYGFPFIKFDEEPELLIIKGRNSDSIKIAANGYLFKTIKNAATDSTELKQALQQYAQYKYLQTLQVNDPNVSVEVKLVPVINGIADTGKISSKIVNGIYEFKNKDTLVLWLKNTGVNDAYINILDIQPDGIINPVLPNKAHNIYPNELNIKAGAGYIFPPKKYSLVVLPPYGTEVFKVFASATEIDLENIATTRGESTRGNLTALEGLVKNSYGTRGTEGTNTSNADGTTTNLLFRIIH